ncbi:MULTISPECIES: efflux RND transporter periplasmic adaptor subunit [Microbulbifer]|uniref:efflux RND transporter periplasmic adaptor subunit n=1 Tax=Microbulbifer TaxID=48073 RepID=UPI001E483128|nr:MULTISPECIES: efflux RND transporter periplasmic adaptor subunit [Microbulbifer]UHQ53945.1 efflux RND transporter periplasmic adaptor subunit [Microbulbifer sp. YPW16]
MQKAPIKASILVATAAIVGVMLGWWLSGNGDGSGMDDGASGERKILYWVAPMDPNYRRDGPGKSPMGMDLIPVYEGEEPGDAPGTVTISPAVENNLGVRTATVERGPVSAPLRTVGIVRLDQDRIRHQHTRLSGWVQKSWVTAEGDRVEKGQPLVEIYSPELVKVQREFLAALGSGNRALIEAARERMHSLGIPAREVQRVERDRRASEKVTLYADASGYVETLGVRSGMYITPEKALVSVGPLDTVWVEGEVFPRQGYAVERGDKVTVRGDFAPGRIWLGQVSKILPQVDEPMRTLTLRVQVKNPDQTLRPGMFVRLELDGRTATALTIPREALIRTGRMERVVLAEGDGRFRSVRVRSGHEFGDRVQILEGLQAGDRVVTSAQFLIDSESSVSADLGRMDTSDRPWVGARVLSMPDDNHYARLDHEPVPAWDWPAMVMGFYVAEEAGDDLRRAMESDERIEVQIRERADGKYEVLAVRQPAGVDHGQMEHGEMDHGDMDHGEMDHDDHGGEPK